MNIYEISERERERPVRDEGCWKEKKSSYRVRIDNEDMVAHSSQSGCFEESV